MNQVRTLWVLLVLTLGGMGAWGWRMSENLKSAEDAKLRTERTAAIKLAEKDRDHEQAMTAMQQTHQDDLQKLGEENQKKMDALRKDERAKLAQAYEQFSHILDGDKKTLDYISLIEQKVKAGQQVSQEEAEKLAVIATGLTYLQKQYRKSFEDFGELAAWFSKRAAANANVETPNLRNAFWKRMFSREFREKEKEFYRNEGERRAFVEAQSKFTGAYASAQKKMSAVSIDTDSLIAKLNEVIQQKQTTAQDFGDFFSQARKALSTHQKMLEFEPDPTKPLIEGARP